MTGVQTCSSDLFPSHDKSTKKSTSSRSGKSKATPKQRVPKPQKAPVAKSAKQTNKGPIFRALPGGGCIIEHSELITTLNSQAVANFQLLKRLRCNPASVGTFNWLSRLAPNYEMYKFHKLHFRYETRSPTTVGGSLIMSPDYDAADGSLGVDESSLYNNRGSVDDSTWKSLVLKLERNHMNRLYKSHVIMSDARFMTTSQDEKTIDVAQVFIGTDCQSALALGKLFVDYVVELSVPSSVQEEIGQGGALSTNIAARAGNVNSSFIIAQPSATKTNTVDPAFQWLNALVSNGTANTPSPSTPQFTVGRFTRDWQGIVNMVSNASSSTFTGEPQFFIMKDTVANAPNAIPDAGNSILQNKVQAAVLPTLTSAAYAVVAQAGDYLKLRSTADLAGTGSTDLKIQLGSALASTLLL